jgi:hypothetical protein
MWRVLVGGRTDLTRRGVTPCLGGEVLVMGQKSQVELGVFAKKKLIPRLGPRRRLPPFPRGAPQPRCGAGTVTPTCVLRAAPPPGPGLKDFRP